MLSKAIECMNLFDAFADTGCLFQLDAVKEEPRSFIFVSEGALTTDDKLIIFIHGSGVVRAGQWARR